MRLRMPVKLSEAIHRKQDLRAGQDKKRLAGVHPQVLAEPHNHLVRCGNKENTETTNLLERPLTIPVHGVSRACYQPHTMSKDQELLRYMSRLADQSIE